MQSNLTNNKQLDSYSMLITSKYLKTQYDYINVVCVCKKFKETTEKLRFNPIPIKSLSLFPKIQTQYLYSKDEKKINGIDNYETWYEINYDEYLKLKEENIKYHNVVYTQLNKIDYGNTIPNNVRKLYDWCFSYHTSLTSIKLPTKLTSFGKGCFCGCSSLQTITIPSLITSLSGECFSGCRALVSIDLPTTLRSIGVVCFMYCSSLESINLPSTLTSLGNGCFYGCDQLKHIINVPDYCY